MGFLDAAARLAAFALIAVWVGYPAVIALLAAIPRKRRAPYEDEQPRVSIVIATRDDAGAIRSRVEDCLRQEYEVDKLQVVVALDARSPLPLDAFQDLGPEVSVVRGDGPGGKAGALNAGVRVATGDVLVFTDAHQRFEPQAVRFLVRALQVPGVGVASGSLVIPSRAGSARLASLYWRFERWLRRCEAQVRSCVGVSGSIYAMQRVLWKPLPIDLINDDVYIPMRAVLAGWRVGFSGRAQAIETRQHSELSEYHRKVRTLTGVVQLCVRLPALLVPIRNPIWPQFLFHKLLRLLTPYWVLILLLWAPVAAVRLSGSSLPIALGLGALAVVVGIAAGTRKPWGRRVRRLMAEAVLLNVAVIMAGYNGLRGRWHVWNR